MKRPTTEKYPTISQAAQELRVSSAAIHAAIRQHRLKEIQGVFEVEQVIKKHQIRFYLSSRQDPDQKKFAEEMPK